MSKSKDQTDNTPPLSSGEGTEAREQPSLPLAKTDNTQTFMQTTKPLSLSTSQNGQSGSTTPDNSLTTLQITEKSRQHAVLAKVALSQLEKAGLIKRFKVLSKDATTVQKIRIEFDMSTWTEGLELK